MQDEALRRQDEILRAVGLAAEKFLRIRELSDALNEVLPALGAATDASRVHVYDLGTDDAGELTCSLRYEWAARSVTPQIANPKEQGFPLVAGGYGRWVSVLGEGQLLQGLRDEFPEPERAFLDEEGIRSVLVVPIFIEDTWWGWIGFDDCETDRVWSPAETDALRAAAGLLGAAIQRQRMDARQAEAEAKYQALVEQLPSIVFIETAGPEPRMLYVSPQVKDFYGYSPAEWLKTPGIWESLLHPDDRGWVVALATQTHETGEPFKAEYRMVSRYGKELWVLEEAQLVRDEHGEPRYWQGVVLDVTRQNEMRAQLEQAEQRYQALVEQIPAAVYTESIDPDRISGPILYASPWIERILGLTPDAWMADPDAWLERIHPDDRERVERHAEHVTGSGDSFHVEYRTLPGDGRTVWVLDEAVMVRDDEGEPLLWQGFMFDITDRKEAEARLADAEERYRALVERIPAVLYIDNPGPEYVTTYISPQVEEMFGVTADEWVADRLLWHGLLHPDDRDHAVAEYESCMQDGRSMDQEYRLIRPDGREMWIEDRFTVLKDQEGRPKLIQGVMFDVTRQKAAEAALREAETRFRNLVERQPAITYTEALAGDDGPGEMTYVSPQVRGVLGVDAQEWISDPQAWRDRLHPDDAAKMREDYQRAVATEEPFRSEYRMFDAAGNTVWFRDEAVLVRDDQGRPLFWQGVMIDISERRRAEELEGELRVERETAQRLRDIDDMKNTFLTAVSHDLRTPLAAILGLAVTLEREDLGLVGEDGRDLVKRIADNARKLDRLVTDLLDLDRLTRGILEPKRHPTDVGALVRKVVDEADFLTSHPVTVEADSVVLAVDGAKVERIVENLLANTARHTPKGTQVWVRVWAQDGGVLIAVEDAGPGVSEALRDSVFEPFRQADKELAPSPGVGIGLSLVARFSELHGGRAWVEERSGGGASFRVFLPQDGTHFR